MNDMSIAWKSLHADIDAGLRATLLTDAAKSFQKLSSADQCPAAGH